MAIKKVTFSFDVPITQLLGLIATGHAGLKIDVYGDDHAPKIRKLLNGHAPALLEGPRKRGGKHTAGRDANGKRKTSYRAIWDMLAAHKDHNITTGEMKPAVVAIGLSDKSISPQIHKLCIDGYARRMDKGAYRITARGIVDHAKLLNAEAKGADHG